MIQRIQSIWLFLAAMAAGLLFLPSTTLYRYGTPGIMTGQWHSLSALSFYPLLILAGFMVVLPLLAIFFFKDRPRQRGIATLGILASVTFAIVLFMKVANINSSTRGILEPTYGIVGAAVPVVCIIFLILAIKGIRKDEKVLKSLDRLR